MPKISIHGKKKKRKKKEEKKEIKLSGIILDSHLRFERRE